MLKLFGFFYDEKKIYLILEFAPCGELFDLLQKSKRFPEERAAKVIFQKYVPLIFLVYSCSFRSILIHAFHEYHPPRYQGYTILYHCHDYYSLKIFSWGMEIQLR